jgi:hypothetical protein
MGTDIYKAKYKFVFGPITGEQLDFINDIIYRSDDGTYELNGEHYLELKQKIGELEKLYKTDLKPLFRTFEKETRNGKGHLSFRVFA